MVGNFPEVLNFNYSSCFSNSTASFVTTMGIDSSHPLDRVLRACDNSRERDVGHMDMWEVDLR